MYEDIKEIKRMAALGDVDFIYEYGRYFYVRKDYKQAYNKFILAAENGSDYAQFALGLLYLRGHGVQKDMEEALAWIRIAAAAGNEDANICMGKLYLNGNKIHRNSAKAIKFFEDGAYNGSVQCMMILGEIFQNENNQYEVEKDDKRAFHWFLEAALAGDHDAQNEVGYLLDNGIGCEIDRDAAFLWFKKAVANHSEVAQYNLGEMYEMGKGVAVNIEKAIAWYKKSAKKGYDLSIERLKALTSKTNTKTENDNTCSSCINAAKDSSIDNISHIVKDGKKDVDATSNATNNETEQA